MKLSLPIATETETGANKPQRTMSAGELIKELRKFPPEMPVASGSCWVIGIKTSQGFGDSERVLEDTLDLQRVI